MAAADLDKEMGTMENRLYDLRCQAHASRLLQKRERISDQCSCPLERLRNWRSAWQAALAAAALE